MLHHTRQLLRFTFAEAFDLGNPWVVRMTGLGGPGRQFQLRGPLLACAAAVPFMALGWASALVMWLTFHSDFPGAEWMMDWMWLIEKIVFTIGVIMIYLVLFLVLAGPLSGIEAFRRLARDPLMPDSIIALFSAQEYASAMRARIVLTSLFAGAVAQGTLVMLFGPWAFEISFGIGIFLFPLAVALSLNFAAGIYVRASIVAFQSNSLARAFATAAALTAASAILFAIRFGVIVATLFVIQVGLGEVMQWSGSYQTWGDREGNVLATIALISAAAVEVGCTLFRLETARDDWSRSERIIVANIRKFLHYDVPASVSPEVSPSGPSEK